jgi:NAD-dependent dihydropyrimidine dehydrogenase PreA subunit
MNSFDFFSKNSICPSCSDKFKTEESLELCEQGYNCPRCQKIYPTRKIVYILKDKCNPKKCIYKCVAFCEKNALKKSVLGEKGHFMLNGLLKNYRNPKIFIKEECNNCGKCVEQCPFGALVSIDTPTFLISESFLEKYYPGKNKKSEKFNDLQLRQFLTEKEIRPASFLLYAEIAKILQKKKREEIIIDNGSGINITRTFTDDKINILSLDIRADHNAFYPTHGLANGEQLPIKKECVDSFVSTNVLEHITNPGKYLSEIYRTLKKEGDLIITVPTPWWHLSKLLSIHHYLNYVIHVLKCPLSFLKNPIKDFNIFWSHEKDCNYENTKNASTLSEEIKNFRTERWEKLFCNSSFYIKDRKNVGNVFSNNIFAGKFSKMMGNSEKRPIFLLYVLKKK